MLGCAAALALMPPADGKSKSTPATRKFGKSLGKSQKVDQALPILKKVFARDKNWKELTRRLPPVNLLTVSKGDLDRILAL